MFLCLFVTRKPENPKTRKPENPKPETPLFFFRHSRHSTVGNLEGMVLRGIGRYQARLKRAAFARIKRVGLGVVWDGLGVD